ncbi:MAG: hypothetical protein ABUL58_04725 [Steroidobacter sp.]
MFRLSIPTLETRARIATVLARGIGVFILLAALLTLVVAVLIPEDRFGLLIGGTVMMFLGVAFMLAKPITVEHLASKIDDL